MRLPNGNFENIMKNTFRSLAALFSALFLLAACQQVPLTGRSQLLLLSEGDEVRMGLDSYQEVLKNEKISTDTKLNAQLKRVGERIAAVSGRSDYEWEFKVIEDNQINAFCLPGGKVAVYTGLFPVAKDDAGLAAVVAHEVAHAIARHGGERVSQELLVGTAVAVAAATSSSDPEKAKRNAGLLGLGATVGVMLPFSRLHESEADRMGMILMAKAGYDPHAARDLWVRMAAESRGAAKPPELLSTHPADSTRIANIERLMPEAMRYYKPNN